MEEAEGESSHFCLELTPDSAPSLVDLLQATAKEQRITAPDLSSDATSEYLDQLLSLPLKSLMTEATAISTDAGNVEGELTNLCFREYPTFISVHRCSAAVTSAFDDFSSSLGGLLDAVPALEDECRTFVRSTKGVQNARAKAQLVQEHQDKLFDLLEIPQLMDTCVRNGYYQEALELSAHTDSLLQRYPDIELVQDVAREVDGVSQLMLAQLLALLREPIKLPALVKTVGYLRRLGIIDEAELGLAFLISRLSNFQTQLAGLDRDRPDPVRYVRKYVDLFREHVFDIISQFTAIFLDSGGASPGTAAASAQLATFVGQCVNDLVDLVSAYVPKMNDAASLSSILVQLGYCSLAFARVGLDFSALVTAPFAHAVEGAFTQAIKDASAGLTRTLADAERGAGNAAQALLAPEVLPTLLAAESPLGFVAWDGNLDALPSTLARFPPLAILVNAHLSALNSLRLLAPIALHPRLAAEQAAALNECTHAVARYVRAAVALSDSLAGSAPRAPSSPQKGRGGRAALIRHNSETQLSPEARAARRRETQRVCVAFADTWSTTVVPLLRAALDRGVYDAADVPNRPLDETLDTLQAWVRDQQQAENASANGTGAATALSPAAPKAAPNGSGGLAPHSETDGDGETTEPAPLTTEPVPLTTEPVPLTTEPEPEPTSAVETPALVMPEAEADMFVVSNTPALTLSGVATPAMTLPEPTPDADAGETESPLGAAGDGAAKAALAAEDKGTADGTEVDEGAAAGLPAAPPPPPATAADKAADTAPPAQQEHVPHVTVSSPSDAKVKAPSQPELAPPAMQGAGVSAEPVPVEPVSTEPAPAEPAPAEPAPAEPAPAEPAPAEPAPAEPAPAEPAPAEPAPAEPAPAEPTPTAEPTHAEPAPAQPQPTSTAEPTPAAEVSPTSEADKPSDVATADVMPPPPAHPVSAAAEEPPVGPEVAAPDPSPVVATGADEPPLNAVDAVEVAAVVNAPTDEPAATPASVAGDGADTPQNADEAEGEGEESTEPSRAASPDASGASTPAAASAGGAGSGAKKKKNKKKKKAK